MKASYWQRGEVLDYKNTTDAKIEENTIIPMKTRIGITGGAIDPGQTGSLHVTGVFTIAKATDTDAIELGTAVYYTESGITATASTNVPAGYAAGASAAGDKTVLVKLLG